MCVCEREREKERERERAREGERDGESEGGTKGWTRDSGTLALEVSGLTSLSADISASDLDLVRERARK